MYFLAQSLGPHLHTCEHEHIFVTPVITCEVKYPCTRRSLSCHSHTVNVTVTVLSQSHCKPNGHCPVTVTLYT